MTGQRKTDTAFWKAVIYGGLTLLGAFGGVTGIQVYSPTNAQVQVEGKLIRTEFESYVKSHQTEEKLNERNVQSELTHIKEGIKRLEKQMEDIEDLIRNGNK